MRDIQVQELLPVANEGFRDTLPTMNSATATATATTTTTATSPEGSPRFLSQERCDMYCHKKGEPCSRVCIGIISEEERLCLASIDGRLCDVCFISMPHISPDYVPDFGNDFCPNERVQIDLECPNLARRYGHHDFDEGHMCGDTGRVTFVVPKKKYHSTNKFGLVNGSLIFAIVLLLVLCFLPWMACVAVRMCKSRREDGKASSGTGTNHKPKKPLAQCADNDGTEVELV